MIILRAAEIKVTLCTSQKTDNLWKHLRLMGSTMLTGTYAQKRLNLFCKNRKIECTKVKISQ